MNFAWPQLLWLMFVPAALLIWELTRRRRTAAVSHPKILRAEAGARAVEFKGANAQPIARTKARIWLCLGLALVIDALARPQWGRTWHAARRRGGRDGGRSRRGFASR